MRSAQKGSGSVPCGPPIARDDDARAAEWPEEESRNQTPR
jgi:hypothetical protein